jgi:hypothetical protein
MKHTRLLLPLPLAEPLTPADPPVLPSLWPCMARAAPPRWLPAAHP